MERTGNQYVRGGEYRLDMFGTKMKAALRGTRQIDGSRDSRIFRLRYQNVMKLYTNCFFPLLIGLLLLVVSKFSMRQKSKFWRKASLQPHHCRFEVWKLFYYYNFFLFFFPVVAPAAWDKRTGHCWRTSRCGLLCFTPELLLKNNRFHTCFHRNVSICILVRLQSFLTTAVTSSIKTRSTCSVMKCRQLKKRGNNNT